MKWKPIILDGPVGTEIERRGGDTSMPLWSARALFESPGLIKTIHSDFIKNGAEILTTNTFRTQERTLKRAGFENKGEELSRLAVQLSKEASRGTSVKIAGSIAPLEECYSPHLVPSQEEIIVEHGDMAKWLFEEGIDIFLIETMNTIREAKGAIQATKPYDIPIWLSFTCNNDGQILSGETWSQVLSEVITDVDVIMVNCSTPKSSFRAFQDLSQFKEKNDVKIGLYPNYLFDLEKGKELNEIRSLFFSQFDQIMKMRPDVVGTCCGATPEDTKILVDRVNAF